MVGYLNTQPFKWALEGLIDRGHDIVYENPADCAKSLIDDKVDIALIPVGSLYDLENYFIHTDFCIGCDGKVRTVMVFANQDIPSLHTIYLDNHSRTSQLLTKVLIEDYYGIECKYIIADVSTLSSLPEGCGVLMIGDKVFEHEGNFKFQYDLGYLWKKMTGLPFVFAVWVSKNQDNPAPKFIEEINKRMENVLGDIDRYLEERPPYIKGVLHDRYFKKNISYNFAKAKKMALKLFLQKAALKVEIRKSPVL